MCTMTVERRRDGVSLTVNRDELRGRAREIEPSIVRESPGHPVRVAPMDGERRGTWVGANDDGVIGCLLNRYRPGDEVLIGREDTPSRGWIIDELLTLRSPEVQGWLWDGFDPTPYPSFALVVLTPSGGSILKWEHGREAREQPLTLGWTMETSAFWQAGDVRAFRRTVFEQWCRDGCEAAGGVPTFNLLQDEDHPEWSPLMTRRQSMTRSVTHVRASFRERTLDLRYWRREGSEVVFADRPTTELSIPLFSGGG